MVDQIAETIRSLRSLGHSTDADPAEVIGRVRAESERRSADGDSAFLSELGVALLARHRSEPRAWQYLHTFDHLFKLLVETPGDAGLRQTLRLIGASRDTGRDIDGLAAALIGGSRRRAGAAAVTAALDAAGDADDTFRACLVHELVLREGTITRSPKAAAWAASEAMRRHPLGWLPLDLADFERDWNRGRGERERFEPDRDVMVAAGARPTWPSWRGSAPGTLRREFRVVHARLLGHRVGRGAPRGGRSLAVLAATDTD